MNELKNPQVGKIASAIAPKRPLAIWLLMVLPVLLAFISVPPGIDLIRDPTGSTLNMQQVLPYLTQALPSLHDFTLVGVWLVTMYGILPIIVAVGLWASKRWAWFGSTFLGATVVTWISVELVMFAPLGFVFFYPLIGGIGLAILALSLLPTVRRSFTLRTTRPGRTC